MPQSICRGIRIQDFSIARRQRMRLLSLGGSEEQRKMCLSFLTAHKHRCGGHHTSHTALNHAARNTLPPRFPQR